MRHATSIGKRASAWRGLVYKPLIGRQVGQRKKRIMNEMSQTFLPAEMALSHG